MTPRLRVFSVPAVVRAMDVVNLQALVWEDKPVGIYRWKIVRDETGKAKLRSDRGSNVQLEVYGNVSDVGRKITVEFEASFSNPEAGDSPLIKQSVIEIKEYNRPPVPGITGDASSPSNRIPTGSSVSLRDDSDDPDGAPTHQTHWVLGASRGGSYETPPVFIGAEGGQVVFTVPNMSAPIDQDITMWLYDGLHKVSKTVTVYLSPKDSREPEPPPRPTPEPPPGDFSRDIQCANGVVTLTDAELAEWLVSLGHVVKPPHFSGVWTSPLTTSQLNMVILEWDKPAPKPDDPIPDPEPKPVPEDPTEDGKYVKRAVLRMRGGFTTGISVAGIGNKEYPVSLFFYLNGVRVANKTVQVLPNHPIVRMAKGNPDLGDFGVGEADFLVMTSDNPFFAQVVWITPQDFNRTFIDAQVQ